MSEQSYMVLIEEKKTVILSQEIQLTKEQIETFIGESLPGDFDLTDNEIMHDLMIYLVENPDVFENSDVTESLRDVTFITKDQEGNTVFESEWF